jgi:hypothetical protein
MLFPRNDERFWMIRFGIVTVGFARYLVQPFLDRESTHILTTEDTEKTIHRFSQIYADCIKNLGLSHQQKART